VTLQGFLRRNEQEIGQPLAIHRNRYGIGTVIGAIALFLALNGLYQLNTEAGPTESVLAAAIFLLITVVILILLAGEVLVVCERALVLGPTILRSPFVIRYDQIGVGSLVPVTRARRYALTTGEHGRTSAVRNPAWITQGIHFVGPSPRDSQRQGRLRGALTWAPTRSIDNRWIWFAGTSSTPPGEVTATIAEAAHRAGLESLAAATAAAPVRELTGGKGDPARLLPGYPPAGQRPWWRR